MTPLLTPEAVREWVGDFEIGKGRPYADGSAVSGATRRGDTLLASVRGHRTHPYRVYAALAAGRVREGRCSCPVGGGRCKHVAAILLAYLTDPNRFIPVEDITNNLDRRGREELLSLVKLFLDRTPDLEPLLAVPLPGFVWGPVASELFYQQAMEAIRSAGEHDNWADEEIAANLTPILNLGLHYREAQDAQAADAVFDGVAGALADAGHDDYRLDELVGRLLHPAFRDSLRPRLGVSRTPPPPEQPIPF